MKNFRELVLPLKAVEIPVELLATHLQGQDYLHSQTFQCPKHWHLLETLRGIKPNTVRIGACDACVKELEDEG
jgi:hypothetical protein